MMLPIIGFGWTEFVGGILASLMAMGHRHEHVDPVTDITERLRNPVKWTLRHPLKAALRIRTRNGRR